MSSGDFIEIWDNCGVDCVSVIYEITIDRLDVIGVISIKFGRRAQLFSKLKLLTASLSSTRVWVILGTCRFYMLELVHGGSNIPIHRAIDIFFGVIPVQG